MSSNSAKKHIKGFSIADVFGHFSSQRICTMVSITGLCFTAFVILKASNMQTRLNGAIQPYMQPVSLIDIFPSNGSQSLEREAEAEVPSVRWRAQHAQFMCDQLAQPPPERGNRGMRYLKNDKYKLLYCGITKIGSSFWKRAFKVLDVHNTKHIYLFNMSSMSAHFNLPLSMSVNILPEAERIEIWRTYETMMFIRDPFNRLFSGWVDKVLAPNQIGIQAAIHIKNRNLWPQDTPFCGLRVPFQTFAKYVAHAVLNNMTLNHHFFPIAEQCNPCTHNFTMIGTMESFLEDTRTILAVAGIPWAQVFGNNTDVEKTSDITIIQDIAEREFDFMLKSRMCLTKLDSLRRLWTVYQVRGFISKDIPFPFGINSRKTDSVTRQLFTNTAMKAYSDSGPREKLQNQRREAMLEAFSLLPRQVLEDLGKAFSTDCLLFNYSCDVNQRFPERKKGTQLYYFADMVDEKHWK